MKNFALIGAAGYIAPRHMQAIKHSGNQLIAALDPNDSMGILDSCFPHADYFTEFERFDRHIDKLKRSSNRIDYISICSPNYLHDAHIRFALKNQADAICETPLVLNPWNLDALEEMEQEMGRKIYPMLQHRMHTSIIKLKEKMEGEQEGIHDVELTHIASRGKWYFVSWRGRLDKAGGLATHVGIHYLDLLIWLFGRIKENVVHVLEPKRAAGYLELERARVRWFFSLNGQHLPKEAQVKGQRMYRSLRVDNEEIDFGAGFTQLHTTSYQQILDGRGYGIQQARQATELSYAIRNSTPVGLKGVYHPLARMDSGYFRFPVSSNEIPLKPTIMTGQNLQANGIQLEESQELGDELSQINEKRTNPFSLL